MQLTNSLFVLGNSYSLVEIYIIDRTFITGIDHSICRKMNYWKIFIEIIDQVREEVVSKNSRKMIFCMSGIQLYCFALCSAKSHRSFKQVQLDNQLVLRTLQE